MQILEKSLFVICTKNTTKQKSQERESNPRPNAYEALALPTELSWHYVICNKLKYKEQTGNIDYYKLFFKKFQLMKYFAIFLSLIVLALPSLPCSAADLQITDTIAITDLNIDAVTLLRGYTLTTPAEQFFLGIRPEVLSVETRVVVKQYDAKNFTFPQGWAPVSDVYEFDIFNKAAFQNTKPLDARFALTESAREYKRIFSTTESKSSGWNCRRPVAAPRT